MLMAKSAGMDRHFLFVLMLAIRILFCYDALVQSG